MQLSINIICLDVPYPANYGGAIDMFHKIRWLHKQGVHIYLHCYTYGNRVPSSELNQYCKEIYYYERKTGITSFFSLLPYNVKSRASYELKQNLQKNKFPILFEALHTCYWIGDNVFKDRLKLFRESNIEHHYFLHLAKNEKNILKKCYLLIESFKFKLFEKKVSSADIILVVSTEDEQYFKIQFPKNKIKYMPSFHQNDEVCIKTGVSDYILYHGNLSVSENYFAVNWLIENVFRYLTYQVIIAGLNPPSFLIEKIAAYPHIKLYANCSEQEMNTLVENAQIHCLYTPQATGLKLKLLNVLFKGKFVIANESMIHGTNLKNALSVANNTQEYLKFIHLHFKDEFNENQKSERLATLKVFQNQHQIEELIKLIAKS